MRFTCSCWQNLTRTPSPSVSLVKFQYYIIPAEKFCIPDFEHLYTPLTSGELTYEIISIFLALVAIFFLFSQEFTQFVEPNIINF